MRECPLENPSGAEVFVAYAARTLAPETLAAFEQHMASCADCRELAEAQSDVWAAMDSWTLPPVSPDFNEKLYRRIAVEEESTWWRRVFRANWSWRPAMPVAAACATLLAAFLLRTPEAAPTVPQTAAQPGPEIEQVQHALDDIEMLSKLGVEIPADKTGSPERL